MAWVWKWEKMNVSLNVSQYVAEAFLHHRQGLKENEKGGQLFVDLTRADGLWLVQASEPNLSDSSGRHWLSLDQSRCSKEIEIANKKGLRLIGYWHTHPEKNPKISPKDIESFKRFSKENIDNLRSPLVVIVGTCATNAWIVNEILIEQAYVVSKT